MVKKVMMLISATDSEVSFNVSSHGAFILIKIEFFYLKNFIVKSNEEVVSQTNNIKNEVSKSKSNESMYLSFT
jgi:hypothetical protein